MSKKAMSGLLAGLFTLLVVIATIPMAVIAFSAPAPPPAMATSAAHNKRDHIRDLPEPRHFQARDGTSLQYYAYPADTNKVAVLIHGSAFPAPSMHALAQALRGAGVTTYALDIRGHGGSGRRGDIDYIGQIDDDLADFVAQLGPVKNGETRTLAGFSAGGGFTIRFAGGPYGELFDRYVLLSPILPGSPTLRPSSGGWINVSLPRVVTINWLDRLGIHGFDGVPVLSYAISPDLAPSVTASYSYRLTLNFGASRAYESYLRNIRRPAAILVGGADEQEFADQFAPLLRRLGVNIPVTLVPNMTHTDMIGAPQALREVVRTISPES